MAVGIGLVGLALALPPIASGSPSSYLQALSQVAHPTVNTDVLLFAGQQACSSLQAVRSFDMAEKAVYYSILNRTGVTPNMAEVGTIVHVAVDQLCPEVGYP